MLLCDTHDLSFMNMVNGEMTYLSQYLNTMHVVMFTEHFCHCYVLFKNYNRNIPRLGGLSSN